ncbi:hypothetical protein BG53_08455 [Paenibacillus darwinianus]|uniref:Uncharacterized protein n=1 Tax=Paenibacillus darwinianus TaxID=1380763 RepID=A0A9W5RYY2_9BACL|nr:hypothetical protein [Paenibacillus darwinianus]EXX85413.1 hypothetical protein BG53_08455 [Paenibacillus darwinianus]EXX86234.1 hypothetical protein BG52_06925 [Paenibacillus darwinianus]EXX86625.1 hypothetical protein CH50_06925 [Paenibacillus darwinianus]
MFDPIDALLDSATMEDASVLQRGGRLAGEVISNIPLGQNLAAMYPEYGTNLYGVELPTRKKFFGDKDPTRFGEGLLLTKGIQDPLFKMILPFGGNQLKKSIGGADSIIRGGSFKDTVLTTGFKMENPELKFGIEKRPSEVTRALLFGSPATKAGQEYYNNERRPLSEKQTQVYLNSPDRNAAYSQLMKNRKTKKNKDKIAEIRNDKKMSMTEKENRINNILRKMQQPQR